MTFQPRKPSHHRESRQAWRSKMEKPMGPGMWITLVPTLILCVFLVMAAPYLKSLALKFLDADKEQIIMPIEMAKDAEAIASQGPPPNPELEIAKIYQRLYDKEGFDWRNPPKLELPEEVSAEEIRKEIKPVEVDIPLATTIPEAQLESLSTP